MHDKYEGKWESIGHFLPDCPGLGQAAGSTIVKPLEFFEDRPCANPACMRHSGDRRFLGMPRIDRGNLGDRFQR